MEDYVVIRILIVGIIILLMGVLVMFALHMIVQPETNNNNACGDDAIMYTDDFRLVSLPENPSNSQVVCNGDGNFIYIPHYMVDKNTNYSLTFMENASSTRMEGRWVLKAERNGSWYIMGWC